MAGLEEWSSSAIAPQGAKAGTEFGLWLDCGTYWGRIQDLRTAACSEAARTGLEFGFLDHFQTCVRGVFYGRENGL
jgi:hypothetical protein